MSSTEAAVAAVGAAATCGAAACVALEARHAGLVERSKHPAAFIDAEGLASHISIYSETNVA